jgi:hypothetical protein
MPTPVFEVDVRDVLRKWDMRRARSKQKKIGPSSLGGCRRRAAYMITRQPRDNFTDPAKAIQGTLFHRGILPALRTAHGGVIEVKLENDRVQGACDWLRFDPLGFAICDDVKTVGKDVFDLRVRYPLSNEWLFQLHTYADMLRHGQFSAKEKRLPHEPVDVVDIEVLLICRDDGRAATRKIPFRQSIADEAWAWLTEVEDRVAADGVALVPRDHPGPDQSPICSNCPFLNACWGERDTDGERAPLVLSDAEFEKWLAEYEEARLEEKAAADRKKLARAHLDGQDPVAFASGWELTWTGGKVTESLQPDEDAMAELLEAAGLPVPLKRVSKSSARSIKVKPPKRKAE